MTHCGTVTGTITSWCRTGRYRRGTIPFVKDNLVDKLRPDLFTSMIGRIAAIVGYTRDGALHRANDLGSGR